jgi:hypothetical protein
VLIPFASPKHDYAPLLQAIQATCRPQILIGCSSSGEFTSHMHGEGSACAVALRSSEMRFAAGFGHGLRSDRTAAAKALLFTMSSAKRSSLKGGVRVHHHDFAGIL